MEAYHETEEMSVREFLLGKSSKPIQAQPIRRDPGILATKEQLLSIAREGRLLKTTKSPKPKTIEIPPGPFIDFCFPQDTDGMALHIAYTRLGKLITMIAQDKEGPRITVIRGKVKKVIRFLKAGKIPFTLRTHGVEQTTSQNPKSSKDLDESSLSLSSKSPRHIEITVLRIREAMLNTLALIEKEPQKRKYPKKTSAKKKHLEKLAIASKGIKIEAPEGLEELARRLLEETALHISRPEMLIPSKDAPEGIQRIKLTLSESPKGKSTCNIDTNFFDFKSEFPKLAPILKQIVALYFDLDMEDIALRRLPLVTMA